MFQGLRQGMTLPIFYKNEPRVAEGQVVSAVTHAPQFNPSQPATFMQGLVTDVIVMVDGKQESFQGLPAGQNTASFPDKGVFIAEDRNAILNEISAMKANSEQVLKQVPAHQKMVQWCNEQLLALNPQAQRDAANAREIADLRRQLSDINGKFDQMMAFLSKPPKQSKKEE